MIRGTTELIAHIGWPTHTFESPMIYNPHFEQAGIDAVVVPQRSVVLQDPYGVIRSREIESTDKAVRTSLTNSPVRLAALTEWRDRHATENQP